MGNDSMGVGGGNNGSVDSSGVHKRVSLSLGLSLSLTLAVVVAVVVAVDSRVDSRVDSGCGNRVDSRCGSVDSTVADGTKTRDNTVAVVDSSDDSTIGQTVGNLPNGVGIGLSLSPGGSNKQNKSEGPHDWRRLVLGENWSWRRR